MAISKMKIDKSQVGALVEKLISRETIKHYKSIAREVVGEDETEYKNDFDRDLMRARNKLRAEQRHKIMEKVKSF